MEEDIFLGDIFLDDIFLEMFVFLEGGGGRYGRCFWLSFLEQEVLHIWQLELQEII